MAPVPVTVTLSGDIATFFTPEIAAFLYTKLGAVSLTLTVTLARPKPPGPTARTVTNVDTNPTVGVPLIVPLVEFTLTPLGKLLPLLSA
jgi:hypothetical protein